MNALLTGVIVLALSLILAACGGSTEEMADDKASATPTPAQAASDTPQVNATPTQNASGEAASGDTMGVAEHLSEKTMQLWEVYNTYDLDALKVFYEANYWVEQEEEVRSNMQPFKGAGMTFTAEETSPPVEIAPGRWEIKHTARFTGGSVNMVFIYEQFGGDWLLTYAESQ